MRWEYLRVVIHGRISSGAWAHSRPNLVHVIGNDGQEIEQNKQTGDGSHSPVVSRLLEKLGDEGWELTGVANAGDVVEVVLYFKRPK